MSDSPRMGRPVTVGDDEAATVLAIRVDAATLERLERVQEARGGSRSEVAREALRRGLAAMLRARR